MEGCIYGPVFSRCRHDSGSVERQDGTEIATDLARQAWSISCTERTDDLAPRVAGISPSGAAVGARDVSDGIALLATQHSRICSEVAIPLQMRGLWVAVKMTQLKRGGRRSMV